MKAWEICKQENSKSKFKDSNGYIWEVFVERTPYKTTCDLVTDNGGYIWKLYTLSEIAELDFEEVVDWSEVPVDTKILVRDSEDDIWERRHFAKYMKGKVLAWNKGTTSYSQKDGCVSWNYAKLYKEGEE